MNYTMQLAKRDFEMGYLSKFAIERMPFQPGWFVLLADNSNPLRPLVDARTKQPRAFKTLDAAVSALHDVGFEINLLSN